MVAKSWLLQTPGGTGALRVAAELLAKASPGRTIWLGNPSWPNHAPIFSDAGLAVREHAFFDHESGTIDFDAMVAALKHGGAGDAVLLHGCCHNPTGASFTGEQWTILIDLLETRGMIPLVDLAYQGLGEGLEQDAAGVRRLLDVVPTALVAYSCDKNFALYRDRVGALWVQTSDGRQADIVRQNMLVLARHSWSMPPDHGAALVRVILSDPDLCAMWREELVDMQRRLHALRTRLANAHPVLHPLAAQQGMFALLPLEPESIRALRRNAAIYMAEDGRINIAGLRDETIAPFVEAITPFLPDARRRSTGRHGSSGRDRILPPPSPSWPTAGGPRSVV